MPDVSRLSNRELDELAQRTDAAKGVVALGKLYEFLGCYVVYPSEHAQVAHTLWVAHTHLMDRWDTTPRLAFLSPEKASGKSRALEVTELLVPCPVMAVNMSPAYIFRKVGSEEGAPLLYDEIDTVFGPKAKENEEIRALLMPVIGAVLLPAVASCMGRKSEPKRSARMRPSRSPAWAGYPILSCRVR